MLIDKTDPLWPRVSAAFAAIQGPASVGLTQDEFAQNAILTFIKNVVTNYEAGVALEPSVDTRVAARVKVESDFVPQFAIVKVEVE